MFNPSALINSESTREIFKKNSRESIEALLTAISTESTYLMLDEGTHNFVSKSQPTFASTVGIMDFSRSENQHVPLATHLFSKLPVLDTAPLDEIADIRSELSEPLTRFRAAMVDLSEKSKAAPMSSEFALEADLILTRDIEPQVLELEERVRSNRYLSRLWDASVSDRDTLTSVFGLALASQSSMLEHFLPSFAGPLAASGVLLSKMKQVANEWRKERDDIQAHQLYFYYQLKKR